MEVSHEAQSLCMGVWFWMAVRIGGRSDCKYNQSAGDFPACRTGELLRWIAVHSRSVYMRY